MKAGGKRTNNVWSIAFAKNTKLTASLCSLWQKILRVLRVLRGEKIRVNLRSAAKTLVAKCRSVT
jgi:hypothetical protein